MYSRIKKKESILCIRSKRHQRLSMVENRIIRMEKTGSADEPQSRAGVGTCRPPNICAKRGPHGSCGITQIYSVFLLLTGPFGVIRRQAKITDGCTQPPPLVIRQCKFRVARVKSTSYPPIYLRP